MSAERALLRRVKVLLECSNMEPLQRQTDLIVGEIKELLAQPESTAEAIMPNGVCAGNVYDAYEEGRKSVMSEQEDIYQKLLRIEEGIEVEIPPSELWLDGYETGKRTMQPEQKPSSDDYYKNIELRKEVQTKTKQEPKVCPNKMRSGSCMLPDPLCGYPNCEK